MLTSLHAQLLSIDLIGLWLAFAVVLTPVAVLVLSSAVHDWFHALRIFCVECRKTALLIGLFSEVGRPVFSGR